MRAGLIFRLFLISLFFSFFCIDLSAQSTAEEIEILLAADSVTYALAARVVLDASEKLITRSREEAFVFAKQQNWLPSDAQPDGQAKLSAVALLFMHAFDINGGIMYSITKKPHYAFRELEYRGIIVGRMYPASVVSGEYLLLMISRIMAEKDRADAIAAERERREARARRAALAAEITAMLAEHHVADTTAQATDEGVLITLSNIQFDADSAVLPESERIKLREIANILLSVSARKIFISGHTADTGNRAGELRLSQGRAQSVADFLIQLGARTRDEITVTGFGASRPIADNSSAQGMAANRRVEIMITGN